MTRSELIERIAMNNTHLYDSDVERLVTLIFDRIEEALAAGERVELRGFGIFGVKERVSRVARNPKTGKDVVVQAKNLPFFKPGKVLKQRVNL